MMSKADANYEDDFSDSGPKHMMSKAGADSVIIIDWDNEEHRRCIAACLVKATCVMENDRTKCRMYNKALAPAWWESFGFSLKKQFKSDSNENDQFTYGAIFELKAPRHPSAPEYVIAFRGTMLSHPKALEDLMQDSLVLFNALSDFSRFKRAHLDVDSLIGDLGNGRCSVWLLGHSLGASLALEIGRYIMSEKGLNVPTFLFNPPHVSPAPVINEVLMEEHKTLLYTVSYMVKFGFAQALSGYCKRTKQMFERLAPWVPELYVNPNDCICRGYIDYFVQRQLVYENHPHFAKTAARTSYRDMFFSMFGNKKLQPHLLPSARLWKNSSQEMDAHGLRQWWKSDSDLALSNTRYGYPLNARA